jgi:hypothetical protein
LLRAEVRIDSPLLWSDGAITEGALGLPEAATSSMGLLVTFAMKPTIEKMTKPANMLVKELMQQTMIESLWKGNMKTSLLSELMVICHLFCSIIMDS